MIDEIYCINLQRRPDRWELMKKRFDKLNLNVTRFNAVDGNDIPKEELGKWENKPGVLGVKRSHMGVFQDAVGKQHKSAIIVFEDDVVLCEDFNERLEYALNIVPEDWKMLYLGYTDSGRPVRKISDNIFKLFHQQGAWAYVIKCDILDHVIKQYESVEDNNDNVLGWYIQRDFPCYAFIPFFGYVEDSYSDRVKRVSTYPKIKQDFKNKIHDLSYAN